MTPKRTIKMEQHEYSSEEFVFIALSIMESQGYYGLIEMMSIIEDPDKIMKILYLMNGMDIKVPNAREFSKALKAATYIYCDAEKKITSTKKAAPGDIREHLNLSLNEEAELLDIFDNWVKFMGDQGYEVEKYVQFKRTNSHKRIKMVRAGKKWTAKKY
jgi:hypothetical protein